MVDSGDSRLVASLDQMTTGVSKHRIPLKTALRQKPTGNRVALRLNCQMLMKLYRLFLFMGIMLHMVSCGLVQKTSPQEAEPSKVESRDAGGYYYYTESRLKRRRGKLNEAANLLREAVVRDEDSLFLKNELVRLYIQGHDYRAALEVTQDIIQKHPDHVPTLVMMGGIHSALNEHAEAVEAYKKALALEPDSENIHFLLGSEYVKIKQPEEALRLYENLIQISPASFAGYFYIGVLNASLKAFDKAEAALLKAKELKPDHEQTLFELINVYEASGRQDKVIETHREILAKNPDNIRAAVGLGRALMKMGQNDEAEDIFEELKRRSDANPDVVRQIALIYLDEERYEEAADTFKLLLKEDVDDPELHYFLGMALEGLEQPREAIASYERVPETSSYYRSAGIHRGFLYHEIGESQEALKIMQEALEGEPDEPELYLFLGALYEEMESYDEAVATLQKGLELGSDTVRLHFRLGVVYDKVGNKDACIQEMRAVISEDPNHAQALNYLGYTYAELGTNLDEAEMLIKRAIEQMPDDGYIVDSLGWVYFKKGLFEKAVEFLEEATRLVPDDPTILEHLGDAYVEVKNPQKGLEYYRKALEKKEEDTGELEQKIRSIEKTLGQDA